MIFERLTLDNFGVYRGEHRLELTTETGRPIILIVGKNGLGMTTLLDACQVVLFGKRHRKAYWRERQYNEYLLHRSNGEIDPTVGAGLTLDFRYEREGGNEIYRVSRTWREVGAGVEEALEVRRNGVVDEKTTAQWQEIIESIMPSELSDLFLCGEEPLLTDVEGAETYRRWILCLLRLKAGTDSPGSHGKDVREKAGPASKREADTLDYLEQLITDGLRRYPLKHRPLPFVHIDRKTLSLCVGDGSGNDYFASHGTGEGSYLRRWIMFAFAQAFSKSLPIVIDSPMGSLDDELRRQLVQNYMSLASHQVILILSESQLDRTCYEALRPFIAREYHVGHDKERHTSVLLPGAFLDTAA